MTSTFRHTPVWGERSDAKRHKRGGESWPSPECWPSYACPRPSMPNRSPSALPRSPPQSVDGLFTARSIPPSICVGDDCGVAGMLSDPTLTVDTLTLAEIKSIADARAKLDASQKELGAAITAVAKSHGAHTIGSQWSGWLCAGPIEGLHDDANYNVTVEIRGRYAYRTKHSPPSMCSGTITLTH